MLYTHTRALEVQLLSQYSAAMMHPPCRQVGLLRAVRSMLYIVVTYFAQWFLLTDVPKEGGGVLDRRDALDLML